MPEPKNIVEAIVTHQRLTLRLLDEGNFIDALEVLEASIELDTDNSLNYYIKGRVYDEMQEYQLSIDAYQNCLSRDGQNKRAKFNLSLAYLSLENFVQGCYYYRYRHSDEVEGLFQGVRDWHPSEKYGSVIIWAEQGIGDEIMFSQFLPFLKTLNFRFYLEADVRLHPILKSNYPWINLIKRGSRIDVRSYSYQVAIGDFLGIFHEKMVDFCFPALNRVENNLVKSAVREYKDKGLSLIGLSWLSMNKEYGEKRSRSIDDMCIGLDPSMHVIVNLQYLAPQSEVEKIRSKGFLMIDDFDCHNDISAVFALISECEKVITIDNSVAHFAGVLGVETEVWVPKLLNWRWGLRKSSTYWYPSVALLYFD